MSKPDNAQKKNKNRKKPLFGISFKASVLIVIIVLLAFGIALLVSLTAFMLIAIDANVIGDRQLGRTFANMIDQDTAVRVYEEGKKIYDGLSEEERSDPTSSAYLSRFTQIKDEDYLALLKELQEMVDVNYLKWIDLRIIDEENNRYVYLMDTATWNDKLYPMGTWEYIDDAINTFWSPDDKEVKDASVEIDSGSLISISSQGSIDGNKSFCTLAPFYHPDTGKLIGYIGIGEENALITDDAYMFAVFYFAIAVLFMLILVLLSRRLIRSIIIDPVKKLTAAARTYSELDDKLHAEPVFANLKIGTHDEIKMLAESMTDMELDLASYMENLTSLTAEQERIRAELGVAETIQTSMLPESLTGFDGIKDFEISSYMKPAREVGGDFYDYFVIDDDHIGLSIADVSGKGVPAALFMAICKTLLKNAAMEHDSPARIVEKVNRQLCENNPEMMFVTVWFGIYNVSDHSIVYVNAGHEYPAVYRASENRFELITEEHDLVLGFDTGLECTEHTVRLDKGDKMFLYTDGVPEATGTSGELYGTDRMTACLDESVSYGISGDGIFDGLVADIEGFISGAEQFDDMTMLLIERVK